MMKKLLSILSVLALTTPTIATSVACGSKKENLGQNTNLQAEMLDGAEFISRLIIASRHENLNFNVNELLGSIISPIGTLTRLPQSYNFEGNIININENLTKYKRFLAPSIDTLDQGGATTTMASYMMGMYDDSFYNSIINGENSFNDTLNQNGTTTKFNQSGGINATGYLAGLHKDLKLSLDEDRRALAWGIQDTGALTNYLLHHGFDGGNPGDPRAKASTGGLNAAIPNAPSEELGGTNRNGYAFYNSLLQAGEIGTLHDGNDMPSDYKTKKVQDKLIYANSNLTFKAAKIDQGTSDNENIERNISQIEDFDTKETYRFNQVGGTIAANVQENNLSGAIALFSSMFDNISTTSTGSLILGELANYILPVSVSDIPAEAFLQAIVFSLITNLWTGLVKLGKNDNKLNQLYSHNEELRAELKEISNRGSLNPLKPATSPQALTDKSVNKDSVGLKAIRNFVSSDGTTDSFDNDANGKAAGRIIDVIDLIVEDFENSDPTKRETLVEELFVSEGIIGSEYNIQLFLLSKEVWNSIVSSSDGFSAINLMKLARGALNIAVDDESYAEISNIHNTLGTEITFRNLSSSDRQRFIRGLGYNGSGYNQGSYLQKIYSAMTDENVKGQNEFTSLFNSLRQIVDNGMEYAHNKVYQYLFDNKYWTRSNDKINTTSNTDLIGELEFTLNYNGVGDSSSNASKQHTKVEVPDDFNPYQIIYKNQSEEFLEENAPLDEARALIDLDRAEKSGKVLGVEQKIIDEKDLIAYDGTGLFENLELVNFEYRVRWSNISSDVNNPYWVITAIDCFDENGNQFYNIY